MLYFVLVFLFGYSAFGGKAIKYCLLFEYTPYLFCCWFKNMDYLLDIPV